MKNNQSPDNQEILPVGDLPDSEVLDAKTYWSGIPVDSYIPETSWSKFIAERVAEFSPSRVFEFGCNAGKNISAIVRTLPSVECSGVDVNPAAIDYARSQKLSVALADERVLTIFPTNAFDVCYTVSVLDHLPNPGPVLAELGRMSRLAVLLLEPWLGAEGKVVRNFNVQKQQVVDTTPYSYSWDYQRLVGAVLPGWDCDVLPYPINTNLGRYYFLYRITPPNSRYSD